MRTIPISSMLVAVLFAAASAFAQQGTAEIGGKVIDEQGAVVPGVAIVVTNEDTGVFREVVTGPDGSYFVSQIVPGRYRISAQLAGFKSVDRRGLLLEGGRSRTGDLQMDGGGPAGTGVGTGRATP